MEDFDKKLSNLNKEQIDTDELTPNDELRSKDKVSKIRMEAFDWLQTLLTALLIAVLLFVFVGRMINVSGSSMEGTLLNGDQVIVSNLFYTPRNGDIIIFYSPHPRFEDPLVKRVIGTPGQVVDIDFETGNVYIDGVVIYEPYINELTTARIDFDGPVTVPEGYVFVLGDNRNRTADSRSNEIGFVDDRYILGRVLMVLIPGTERDGTRDWSRIGSPG